MAIGVWVRWQLSGRKVTGLTHALRDDNYSLTKCGINLIGKTIIGGLAKPMAGRVCWNCRKMLPNEVFEK